MQGKAVLTGILYGTRIISAICQSSRNAWRKFCREQGAYTKKEIGEVYGVGCTAVTGARLVAEKRLRKNKDLKQLVEEIIEELQ